LSIDFIYMSDSHLKGRTLTNNPRLAGDAYKALGKVAKQTAGVKTLVIGGDWFDSNRPSAVDLLYTAVFLSRFQEVYYIRGNHDNVDPSFLHGLSSISNDTKIRALDPETYAFVGDAFLTGVHWTQSRDDLIASLHTVANTLGDFGDRPVYITLHTATRHLLGFDGTWQLDMEVDIPEELRKPNVTFLVGDIHVRDTRVINGCTVHSAGPLYPTRSSEMFRDCAVTRVADGVITDVPCGVRLYSDAGSVTSIDVTTVLDGILEQSESLGYDLPPYVRMSLTEPDIRISEEYRAKCLVDLRGNGSADVEIPSQTEQETLSIDDAIRAETSDDMLADMAVKLVHCDDPVAEIQRWFEFWGVLTSE